MCISCYLFVFIYVKFSSQGDQLDKFDFSGRPCLSVYSIIVFVSFLIVPESR